MHYLDHYLARIDQQMNIVNQIVNVFLIFSSKAKFGCFTDHGLRTGVWETLILSLWKILLCFCLLSFQNKTFHCFVFVVMMKLISWCKITENAFRLLHASLTSLCGRPETEMHLWTKSTTTVVLNLVSAEPEMLWTVLRFAANFWTSSLFMSKLLVKGVTKCFFTKGTITRMSIGWETLLFNKELNLQIYTNKPTRGRIFSHAGNELEVSSFLAGNEFLNDFPLHLVPSWERARFQTDFIRF